MTRKTWVSDSQRGKTDKVARGKYDRMEQQDMHIVERVAGLAERYGCKMSQIALAWHWAKGVAYLEEMYVPHPVVGAIKQNPPQGVMDEKK